MNSPSEPSCSPNLGVRILTTSTVCLQLQAFASICKLALSGSRGSPPQHDCLWHRSSDQRPIGPSIDCAGRERAFDPGPLVGQLNTHRHTSPYPEVLATNGQLDALAFDDCEGNLVPRQIHLYASATECDLERQAGPRLRHPGGEGDGSFIVAHTPEPKGQNVPAPAGGSHVDPIAGVAVQIGEVDEQRIVEVAQREIAVSDLCGDDRLH